MGSCIGIALTLMKMTEQWNLVEALLAVISGLVGKSQRRSGNARHLLLYAIWLLVIGFISMSYTNVLQSIVIVPTMQHIERNFEDMIRQNYTFATNEYALIKSRSLIMASRYRRGSGAGKKFKMLEMQQELAERITERNLTWVTDAYRLVEEFSEGHKKVYILKKTALEEFGLFLPPLVAGSWWLVLKSSSMLLCGGISGT